MESLIIIIFAGIMIFVGGIIGFGLGLIYKKRSVK